MAQSVRFLQFAGSRFDSPSWEGPEEWVAQRNQDLWLTFEAVLSLCQSERIELLFLTGDLFEQEYVRKETVERVARSLAKLKGTKIFMVPGQRDPLVTTSAYRLAGWPSNGSGSQKVGKTVGRIVVVWKQEVLVRADPMASKHP